ncbi:MAG TPA: MFS transporter, partial [Acidiferrobacteraceae bacterium]|nr:MFS transporter [Acidiferrobacteraceae bacterium]
MQAGFRGALRSTDFLKLWIGQVISMLGDRLGEMGVVALYVAQGARSVTVLLATLSALVIAPQIVVSPWAGALIDRSDRRRVLMVSDGVRAGLVLLLPVAWFVFGTAGVYVVVVLLGTATACFTPAKSAILPLLVPAESLAAGNGMSATTNVLATLVGSYLGAHLAQSLGVDRGRPATPFFIIDALSYGVSALLIWRIARSLHVSRLQPAATDARDFRIRPLLPMLLLAALFWITAAVTYSAMNSFAFVRFHKGILGIGDMQAALGGGMLLGALLAGRDPMPFFAARVWPLLFTTAVGLAVLQAARAWLLAVAAVVVVGAAAAWVLVAVDTHLQRQVPDARRGRIFGLKQQWTALAFIAPSLGLRALTDADATLPALLVATAWILGMVGAAVLWMAILERLDRAHRADWGPRWLNRLDGLN